MFKVTRRSRQQPESPFGPAVEYDAQGLASATLFTRSPILKHTGRLFVPRWEAGQVDAAYEITRAVIRNAAGSGEIHLGVNTSVHSSVDERLALADSFGFELIIEKEGFWWAYGGEDLIASDRITVRSLAEVGPDAYAQVMAEAAVESLDAVQSAEVEALGPVRWSREFIEQYVGDGDDATWLVAHDKAGEPVGFVAVGHFEDNAGTIYHIGVARPHRGHGYVNDLVQAAKIATRSRGWTAMLNEVDVRNAPMIAAMERSGHRADATPWHKWYFRLAV